MGFLDYEGLKHFYKKKVLAEITKERNRSETTEAALGKEIAVERARISNLATLKEGSTTGDAELIDIRAGADGTVYKTAGEAVRGQITDLKSDLKRASGMDIVHTNVTYGSFAADGATIESKNRARIHPTIKVRKGDSIQINNGSMYGHAVGMWKDSITIDNCIRNDNEFTLTAETINIEYDGYVIVVFRNNDNTDIDLNTVDGEVIQTTYNIKETVMNLEETVMNLEETVNHNSSALKWFYITPPLRNGSAGNPLNEKGIGSVWSYPVNGAKKIMLSTNIKLPSDDYFYYWVVRLFTVSGNETPDSENLLREVENIRGNNAFFEFSEEDVGFAVSLFLSNKNGGEAYPLRVENVGDAINVKYIYDDEGGSVSAQKLLDSFNGTFMEEDVDWETKCREYTALFNNTGTVESFVFFTDPHLSKGNDDTTKRYISTLQRYANNVPADFVLCGGDWLDNGDTQAGACFKLGYIDGYMNNMFRKYYPVLGNHDTNYQGYEYMQSGYDRNVIGQCMLTNDTLRNLWFREFGKLYYSFDGTNTKFYVFDTGLDWFEEMTDYRWEQVDWLAGKLKADDAEHSMIAMHIYVSADTTEESLKNNPAEMATNIVNLCAAYNNRRTITLNGKAYNFSGCTGKMHCILTGHVHADFYKVDNGIPVIGTAKMKKDNTPTFDLCLVDYGANQMKMVRVGSGSNRTIDLA